MELDLMVGVVCAVLSSSFTVGLSVFFAVMAVRLARENRGLCERLEAQEVLLERQDEELKVFEAMKDERHRPVLVATQGPRKREYAYVRFIDSMDGVYYPSKDWLVGDLMVESEAKRAGYKPSGETIDRRLNLKEA